MAPISSPTPAPTNEPTAMPTCGLSNDPVDGCPPVGFPSTVPLPVNSDGGGPTPPQPPLSDDDEDSVDDDEPCMFSNDSDSNTNCSTDPAPVVSPTATPPPIVSDGGSEDPGTPTLPCDISNDGDEVDGPCGPVAAPVNAPTSTPPPIDLDGGGSPPIPPTPAATEKPSWFKCSTSNDSDQSNCSTDIGPVAPPTSTPPPIGSDGGGSPPVLPCDISNDGNEVDGPCVPLTDDDSGSTDMSNNNEPETSISNDAHSSDRRQELANKRIRGRRKLD